MFNRDEPDREKLVFVTVKASDQGRPPLEDVCTIKVKIKVGSLWHTTHTIHTTHTLHTLHTLHTVKSAHCTLFTLDTLSTANLVNAVSLAL